MDGKEDNNPSCIEIQENFSTMEKVFVMATSHSFSHGNDVHLRALQ